MSATGWGKLDIADSAAIQTLQGINEGATSIVQTMSTLLNVVKTVLDIVKNFLVSIPDLETAALKAAIELIRELLKDLTDTSGCYFLAVPIQIVNVVPEETILYEPQPGGWSSIPALMTPPVTGGSGGNYGFMKAVVDSLNDRDDVLRPQLDSDAHVAGLVVLAGSSTYLDMLPLIEKFVKLFSGNKNSGAGEGMMDFSFPRPKGLRASLVPAAVTAASKVSNRLFGTSGEHICGVRLQWDRDDRQKVIQAFNQPVTVTIKKVSVFRSEYPILPSATYTQLEQDEDVGLLAEFEYDGWNNEFYDDSIALDRTYYYAVGYQTESVEGEGTPIEYVSFFMPITHVYVPPKFNTMPRKGVPPDWMLLPSPISLIPGIDDLVAKITLFLDTLEKRLEDSSSKYKKYIEALSAEIDRYIRLSRDLLGLIQELIDLLTFPPDVYIGAYAFAGKGGNNFFINELGKALNDTTDSNRPPFDQGSEVVTGFVLMAGSATAGKLTAFKNLLDFLFFSSGSRMESAAAAAYAAAAASIDTGIEAVQREIDLLANLELSPEPITPVITPKGIGPDLEPADEQNDGKECTS